MIDKYNQDFTVCAGNDENISVKNILDERDGKIVRMADVQDITWAVMPHNERITPPLIEKSMANGQILMPEDGTIVIVLDSSDTENLSGEFTHELKLSNYGKLKTVCRGMMTVKYKVANDPNL